MTQGKKADIFRLPHAIQQEVDAVREGAINKAIVLVVLVLAALGIVLRVAPPLPEKATNLDQPKPAVSKLTDAEVHAKWDVEFDQQAICQAIHNGWAIILWYRPGEAERKVLPRYLGNTRARNQILNGWQISGFSKSGGLPGHRSFRLDRTTDIEFTTEHVIGPTPSGRLPSGMVEPICVASD